MVLEALGGLVGGAIGLATAGKGGRKEYKKALKAWEKLKTSDFDFTALDPPELRVLAEQLPEVYQAVVPAEFQQIAAPSTGREAQVSSLGQLQEIAREGLPLADRLAAAQGGRAVTSAAAASQQDALRRLAARGQLGTGDELQAQLAGSQRGSNLARDIASDLAQQSAQRRFQAIGAAGQAGAQLQAGDVDLAARNTEIVNRFRELFSQLKTQEARDATAGRERAQSYNVQTRQNIGSQNTLSRYQAALENLSRQNQLRQAQFGQNLAKTQGVANALNTYGQYKDAVRNSRIQAASQIGAGVGGVAEGALTGGLGGGGILEGLLG